MSRSQAAFAHFNSAANFYRQRYYARAIQCYQSGLEIDPMCVEAYADLAKACEKLGYWDQAIESLEAALGLRPGYPTALRRKQRILEEKRVYDNLTDALNLSFDTTDRHQLSVAVQAEHSRNGGGSPKIEREFFTLTGGLAIPQNLLLGVSRIIEHVYHEIGKVFRCYPQHKVPVFIETADQVNRSQIPDCTLFSDTSLPKWAVACYDNGSIRLTYHPDSNASMGILCAVIRHEWTHLLVDLLAKGRCPKWLDEGLAQFMARPLINSEKMLLQQASRDKHFLPFHSLQKPFQYLQEGQRRLAYLQSYAITRYLIQQFSFSALRDVLEYLSSGESADTAFQKVFGKTEEEIVASSSTENFVNV